MKGALFMLSGMLLGGLCAFADVHWPFGIRLLGMGWFGEVGTIGTILLGWLWEKV